MAMAASFSVSIIRPSCLRVSSSTVTLPPASTLKSTQPKRLKALLNQIHLPLFSLSPFHRRCLVATSDNQESQEDQVATPSSASNQESRLYVGNLPYSMTSPQLAEVFQEAGTVDSVEVVYDRVTDRSRGFAFVTMGSHEEAKEAIRMFDGSQVGGRSVKVNFPEVPRGGEREVMAPRIRSSYRGFIDSPYKIYAGNLGWSLTSEALKDAFASQPGLLGAKVIYDRDTGRSRGFGFITFASMEEAESAINVMNGVGLEGRPLRLNLASERASPAATPRLQETETDARTPMQSTTGY